MGVASQTSTRRANGKAVEPRLAKAQAIAKARSLAHHLSVRIGSIPKTKFRGNADIFGRLVEDHDRHRALLAMIEETKPHDPIRKRLFVEFVKEVKAHAAAEEQALWSTILRDPATTDVARHAISEHKELEDIMADLAARDITSRGWKRRFGKLKEEYLHHIREEEQEQFRASEKQLAAVDIRHMRSVFNRRKTIEKSATVIEKKLKR